MALMNAMQDVGKMLLWDVTQYLTHHVRFKYREMGEPRLDCHAFPLIALRDASKMFLSTADFEGYWDVGYKGVV
jgi:hypothetical protein